ncbi:unnamed protein product [Blepharisma stoltei]|uniref:START domain-containing protein n=1 Tax=Blepharisma stoltei TaxID=1481888 RepID=A0AAU9IKT2_9CILI|nr:unnamed protein product [Blepharisma stoltei]
MGDVLLRHFASQIAEGINHYWYGREKEAKRILLDAEKELEDEIGIEKVKDILDQLDPWMIQWKDIINPPPDDKLILISQAPKLELMQIREVLDESIICDETLQSEIEIELEKDDSLPEISNKATIESVLNLYYEDRIQCAYFELNKLINESKIDLRNSPKLLEIQNDYNAIRKIYKELEDTEGWITDHDGAIKISHKLVPGTPTCSIMSETTFDLPVFNLLTLMYETDLYPLWIPFCKKTTLVKKIARSRKVILQYYNVAGIAKRETCLYGYGADLLKSDGCIMIVSNSCDKEDEFKGVKLPPKGKVTRAIVNFFGCVIRPINRNRTYIKLVSNFDPVLKYLPYRILNYFSRKLAKGMVKRVKKYASRFEGSQWQENMSLPENRDFYEFLSDVLESFYQSKGL